MSVLQRFLRHQTCFKLFEHWGGGFFSLVRLFFWTWGDASTSLLAGKGLKLKHLAHSFQKRGFCSLPLVSLFAIQSREDEPVGHGSAISASISSHAEHFISNWALISTISQPHVAVVPVPKRLCAVFGGVGVAYFLFISPLVVAL